GAFNTPTAQRVADINTTEEAFGSQPSDLVAVGSSLFFVADDGIHGHDLWKLTGTTAELVHDAAGDVIPNPGNLTAAGNDLYFTTQGDRRSPMQLWRLNADGSLTSIPGNGSFDFYHHLSYTGGSLYFLNLVPDPIDTEAGLWRVVGDSAV